MGARSAEGNRSRDRRGIRRSLVTGGAGFIGSHLVDRLLERGDDVTVVDDLSTGRRANLPDAHPRLRFIEADLAEALPALGRGETFHEVYHLAAAVGVRLVVEDPIGTIERNVERTGVLLRFAQARGPGGSPAPTLIASSSEVYGKSTRVPFREQDDVVLGPTSAARWSYACSKMIDEYLALAYARDRALPVVIVRLFNTIGPRQVGDYGMVVPRLVAAALAGRPLEVYGDGRQTRSFCDVRDVVELLPRLLAEPACHGQVFNVGSDRAVSIAELAALVRRVTGSSSTIRQVAYEEAYREGFEDPAVRQPDLSRLRAVVPFEPRFTLEQTIRDVAAWMRGADG